MVRSLVNGVFVVMALLFSTGTAVAADVYINKDNSALGRFIADENRMTLYTFTKDAPGKSMCGAANDCIKKWPVFFAETIDAEVPMKNSDFATIVRDDGAKQTTYKGMPLYYFVKDTKVGDTQGHGVNGVWFVAKP
jgi:predicted lipoprotein with Yx(FWY)xxD motif